jgi:hypothetical protein
MNNSLFPKVPNQTVYLDPVTASDFLKQIGFITAPKTLAKLRCIGGGPEFRRYGRQILYERNALESWASKRLSSPLRSTSQTQ